MGLANQKSFSGKAPGNGLVTGIASVRLITAKRAPLCAGGEKRSEPSSCRAN